jgi:cell division protein FtsB
MRQRPGRSTRPRGPARPGLVRANRPVSPAPPSVSRPAGRRPTGGGRATVTRTTANPRRRPTVRVMVLAVVLVALALSYVFPLRVYLSQQAEIAQRRAELAEQAAYVDALSEEAARWRDEDFLRRQARMRLYYGEPGEVLLTVVWEDEYTAPETGYDPDDVPVPPGAWWETLWSSVQSAGAEPEESSEAAEPDQPDGQQPEADGQEGE